MRPRSARRRSTFRTNLFFWYAQGVLLKDGLKAKNWSDLDREDVRIAVTLGTAPDRELTKRLPKAKIERFANMDEAIAAFHSGRVDAASFYHPALVMQQARVKKGTVVIPEPVVALSTSAGIRREDDKTFRDFSERHSTSTTRTGRRRSSTRSSWSPAALIPKKAPPIVKEQWGK